jgi:hypothetical protein
MKKEIFAALAAFALVAGPALAQETQSESSTTKTYNDDGSVHVKKKSHTVDANGNETEHKRTTTSDASGTESHSVTQTDSQDGTSIRTKKESVTNPNGDTETQTNVSKEKW